MQKDGNNFHYPPRPGDGTLPSKKPWRDANWFGPSSEPQEEFIDEYASRNETQPPLPEREQESADHAPEKKK